ncbi:MAG: HupE/UreJ family protein [Opitutaceae bacterium]
MADFTRAPLRFFLLRGLGVGLALGLLGAGLRAHDPGLSTMQGEWRGGSLTLTTGFAPADVEALLPPEAPRAPQWGPAEFEAVRPLLFHLAARLWEVRRGARVLEQADVRVELLPGDNVSFQLRVDPGEAGEAITVRSLRLADLGSVHRQFALVLDEAGRLVARKLLSGRDPVLEVPRAVVAAPVPENPGAPGASSAPAAPAPAVTAAAEESALPTLGEFLWLGVQHIWTGYDHLLFLFALLVVCRTFRSIVAIITCFTLAHSLTLAAATLDWVRLAPSLVEPIIAATIVYVGGENLWRRGAEPPGRWLLTFGFGLIHGFGFASILRDLGVGADPGGILGPLFAFNLGVELGQVAIAAVVMPLVWRLRQRPAFVTRGVPVLSGLIALLGLYWLLERTVF